MKQLLEGKIKEMVDIMQAGLTKDEFLTAFKQVLDHVKRTEDNFKITKRDLNSKVDTGIKSMKDTIKRMEDDNKANMPNLKKWVLQKIGDYFIKNKVNEKISKLNDKVKELDAYVPPNPHSIALEASKMAKDGVLPLIPIIDKLEEKLPEMGGSIANALEAMPDDEKLEIDAIKNLREKLEELERKILRSGSKVLGGGIGGIATGGGIVRYKDLSSLLDGATKTFPIPSAWRVLDIRLSSAPVLQETVDWTHDVGASTITFTSAVDAATYLASGQTCLVEYAE